MRTFVACVLALLLLNCSSRPPTPEQARTRCPAATETAARELQGQVQALKRAGKWAESIEPTRCLVSIAAQIFGPQHVSTVNLRRDLVASLCRAKQTTQATRAQAEISSEPAASSGPVDETPLWERVVTSKSLLDRGDVEGAAREVAAARKLALASEAQHSLTYAAILNEGARVFEEFDDKDMAAQTYQESAELAHSFGTDGREAEATALNNWGLLELRRGQAQTAKTLLERSVGLERKSGLEVAARVNLALVYEKLGQHEQARKLYLTSRDELLAAAGPAHPNLAAIYINLTVQSWAQANLAEAAKWQGMVNQTVEQNVQGVLALGSERQKLAYMAKQQPSLDASVDLCMASARTDSAVGKMALEAVLQRKGRVLAAYAASLARVRSRSSEADATLWKKFVDQQRTRSAKLTTDAPSQRDVVYEDLLAQIGGADAAFEDVTQSATVEQVRAALPARSALIEFVSYRPQHELAKPSIRYAAFALSPNGSLSFAPLGDEEPLLRRVNDLRAALTNPESSNVAALGRELFDAVLAPIAASLSDVDRLFVSTDGVLNLVPFAALVDTKGQYLVDRFTVGYLTSGRSLLRRSPRPAAHEPPLVVVNPDFGPCGNAKAPVCVAGHRDRPTAGGITRLCDTQAEGKAISRLLPHATFVENAAATETLLKGVRGPRILHVATHGFFGSALVHQIQSCRIEQQGSEPAPDQPLSAELSSGLVLAGANVGSRGENGLLTAAEVTAMDLSGTELVVLSACDTALGDARRGEGVFGLRRAFELAGAASQVMTLWKVDSESTVDLMVDFYRSLEGGPLRLGVADALTLAQRSMLHSAKKRRAHPYYWAPVIASGEWRASEKPTAER